MSDVDRFMQGEDRVDLDEIRDFVRALASRNRVAEGIIQALLNACDSYSDGLASMDMSSHTPAEYVRLGARLFAQRIATACGHGLNTLTRSAMK